MWMSVSATTGRDAKVGETKVVDCGYSAISIPSQWHLATHKDFRNIFFKYNRHDVAISYRWFHDAETHDSAWVWRVTWNHDVYPISQDDVHPLVMPLLKYFYGIETQPIYDSTIDEWTTEETSTINTKIKRVHIRRELFKILMLVCETDPYNDTTAKLIYGSWTTK